MVEIKDRYQEYNKLLDDEKSSVSFNKIFVEVKGTKIPLKDLYLIKKDKKGNIVYSEKVKNFKEFDKNVLSYNIFVDKDGLSSVKTFKLFYENFKVPTIFTCDYKVGSSVDSTVDNGLNRTLQIEKANAVDTEQYYYLQTKNGWEFSKIDDIYWFDGNERKTYQDFTLLTKPQKDKVKLFSARNEEILQLYTETSFKFSSLIASDKFNLLAGTKTVYELDESNKPKYKTISLNQTLSYQEFQTKDVEVELNKLKTINVVKTTNYKATDNGKYIAVTVGDYLRVIKIADIIDDNGNPISDIKSMLGKSVKVKQGDNIFSTNPLTYEQVNTTYDSVKTYQELEGNATNNSCLRLEDGSYVEELKSVQPISYKRATASDVVDSYLVEDEGVFKIVDKDYFTKYGKNSKYDATKAVPLTRCDFKHKDCEIVQTTSTGAEEEMCSAIKDGIFVNGKSMVKEKKNDVYNAFLTSYKDNKYIINDIYLNGKKQKLQKNSKRYEYTDFAEIEDYAENLAEYKALKTRNLVLKDGKIIGGGKYDIGKGMSDAYAKWLKQLKAAFFIVPAVSLFFLPISLPIAAAYGLGVTLAAPIIPIWQIAKGIKLNYLQKRKVTDKVKYNQKEISKVVEKELANLRSNKNIKQNTFEDLFARINNKISMLAATTTNTTLNVNNGSVVIDHNNFNLAYQYKKQFNANAKNLAGIKGLVQRAQKKFDKIDAKKNNYGSTVPTTVLSKWYKAQTNLQELTKEETRLNAEQNRLLNISQGKSYADNTQERERLQNQANALKLETYLEHTSPIATPENKWVVTDELQTKLDAIRSRVACNNLGITIEGVDMFAEPNVVATMSQDWKNTQKAVLDLMKELEQISINKPQNANVRDEVERFMAMEKFDELIANVENEITLLESEISKLQESKLTELKNELQESVDVVSTAKNDVILATTGDEVNSQIEIVTAESEKLKQLSERVKKELEKQQKQLKVSNVKVDNVRLNGEKLVCDKINDLLTSSSYTDEDKYILDVLLTKTGLDKKELLKKLKALLKKMQENINKSVNTKLSKGYLPYTIVETIATELHLDKKMFEIDPNQYSMQI